ncbi:DUF4148 domain-containing protein [Paraburkholderia solisilvae]|uniref:DUF4148 domain-containing protein n=2 Tax=Paraburkholderia solisilvae TaxID=624376 RepID=A0A6J5EXC3_9BURK|nr:hypothetical protein LMG29739_05850 [Paraburkholderia solisilvae]
MKIRFATPLVAATALAVSMIAGAAADAAQAGELTRAQVRAELNQLRAAGYDQSVGEDVHYPDALQQAQARVNAAHPAVPAQDTSGYGSADAGTSATGDSPSHRSPARRHLDNDGMKPIYFGQ